MGPAGRNTKGTGSQVPLSFFQPFRPSRTVPSAFRWQRYPGGELSRQPRAREAGAGRRAARALTSRRRRTTPALPTPARVRFPAGALTAGQGTCAVLRCPPKCLTWKTWCFVASLKCLLCSPYLERFVVKLFSLRNPGANISEVLQRVSVFFSCLV